MSKKFPLFIDIENKNILVVGAGKIAKRRIKTLLKFSPKITVISASFPQSEEDKILFSDKNINCIQKICNPFEGDCSGYYMVFACTDDRQANHDIYLKCTSESILVNVCDSQDECSFFFPAIVEDELTNTIVSVCGDGTNHNFTRKIADRIRHIKDQLFS